MTSLSLTDATGLVGVVAYVAAHFAVQVLHASPTGRLAIALNVTLRWLKGRPLLAAMLGALLGPLSFIGGVRLGGAQFVDRSAALGVLALQWGLAMPLVMALSNRFGGVAKARDHA